MRALPNVRVEFNRAALRSIAIAGAEVDLRRRANNVLNAARRNVPVDTGVLRASLAVSFSRGPQGEPVARIGSNLSYALPVHEGTGIYGPRGTRIYPRYRTFLRWPAVNNSGHGNRRYSGGRTSGYVFARSVRGMRGRPYLLLALDAAR